GHGDRVGLVLALVLAVLDPGRERDRAGPIVEQVAGQVGRGHAQLVAAAVAHDRLDEGEHLRGDRADAAEQVERHAAADRGAGRRVAQGLVDAAHVVAAGVGLLGLALAAHQVEIPAPLAAADIEQAVEPEGRVPGLDLLHVAARPALHRPGSTWCASAPPVVRSRPKVLWGLAAEIASRVSAHSLYTPASVPRKIGSGAAWLADSRSL